ncbi:hydrolase 1, exosortase A system-associated [Pseudoduganella albidiflava]|uniref:Hydrolase 1, exosortase A system-associated n=1 Tax=Pseudoduganella albidiflava TaxID=321983 RepID=A0A411X5D4_9BURK|nr:hydrolase 1, exosortase A system-associated [Pseudoduganella albidiflava]QBI04221.1 hydrolase 1, exosortase A system-associated [Pseudoduganella albidiflava]GGY25583.1 hydrolase 1, exosortase A system-associated [Pseudoduganella albidiflava]
MQPDEQALTFPCADEWLTAILSPAAAPARRGVLIVVGGPQYRAGSHRQFALLARALAAQGIPAMRFDYRGMGDSSGPARNFEGVDADLRAAIDRFMAAVPGLQEVVIWGLCDAASAALFYARHDRRVSGLVLLNPWARTPDGLARATLKHYYVERLLQPALWKKIASGQFEFGKALRSFSGLLRASRRGPAEAPVAAPAAQAAAAVPAMPASPDLHARMLAGWQGFAGPILLIISGADLTAQEFLDMVKASRQWRKLLAAPRVQRHTLHAADHTFSRREWRDQVAAWTAAWVAETGARA